MPAEHLKTHLYHICPPVPLPENGVPNLLSVGRQTDKKKMLQKWWFSSAYLHENCLRVVGCTSQRWLRESLRLSTCRQRCCVNWSKRLTVGTHLYPYVFTIAVSWSVLLDCVEFGRYQSEAMPLGLLLSTLCYHILGHWVWLLKLCLSSPAQTYGLGCESSEPAPALILHSPVVIQGGSVVGCLALLSVGGDAPPECTGVVWLSGVRCLGTSVGASEGTGDTWHQNSVESPLVQELAWDLEEIILLTSVLLWSKPPWVTVEQVLDSTLNWHRECCTITSSLHTSPRQVTIY